MFFIKADVEIYTEIAEKMGIKEEFTEGKTEEDWLKKLYDRCSIPMPYEEFKEKGYYIWPFLDDYQAVKQMELFYKDPQNNPSIGILTSRISTNYYPKGKKARLFKEMITYGRERGLFIFYFYPEDVNWENKIFKGFTCNKEGRWITGCYPLPDIVYNRIVYRTIETREEVAILLKRCEKEKHIFLFNSRFLDKWEVYQAIARHTAELQLTPENIPLDIYFEDEDGQTLWTTVEVWHCNYCGQDFENMI